MIGVAFTACALLAWPGTAHVWAQATSPVTKPGNAPAFEVLKGAWVRPDGGYMIAVNRVAADGRIDATYFNPTRLPFARAQATRAGSVLRVALELQAGGYAGSTYDLAYDPVTDRLQGTYYQAVARQKFDVYFARK